MIRVKLFVKFFLLIFLALILVFNQFIKAQEELKLIDLKYTDLTDDKELIFSKPLKYLETKKFHEFKPTSIFLQVFLKGDNIRKPILIIKFKQPNNELELYYLTKPSEVLWEGSTLKTVSIVSSQRNNQENQKIIKEKYPYNISINNENDFRKKMINDYGREVFNELQYLIYGNDQQHTSTFNEQPIENMRDKTTNDTILNQVLKKFQDLFSDKLTLVKFFIGIILFLNFIIFVYKFIKKIINSDK
ncbi:hypothetical protein ATP_00488 [Candidatus Phytoplasma mali]|uniref:Uncharacterized protein n=1 Tax=Phytoplasma mali (strain AT) TaxID=482235 RepID=B3R033_PHYMT|nr:hypothetical protein [Candidatus Phytoplasma mali]CAP18197.1 hypothetical protein ATP_00010 [Candidatus Phytoplasma mali]CAP18675.1 hypothetical protein ATP_00488 [Candidatus Phytoplasma mali]